MTIGLARRIALLFCGAIPLGCSLFTDPAPPGFGAHYRVLFQPAPVLSAQSLSVTVWYGGCRNNHEFALRHEIRPGGDAHVWLQKVTPNEPCDMLVTERRDFSLPNGVRDAAVVELLTPDNDPYPLRP